MAVDPIELGVALESKVSRRAPVQRVLDLFGLELSYFESEGELRKVVHRLVIPLTALPISVQTVCHLLVHSPVLAYVSPRYTSVLVCVYFWLPALTLNGHPSIPFGSEHVISVFGSNIISRKDRKPTRWSTSSPRGGDRETISASWAYGMPHSVYAASVIMISFSLASLSIFTMYAVNLRLWRACLLIP